MPSGLKVLEINKYYYLKGGAEKNFFDISNLLKKNGFKVVHFSMENEKNIKTDYKSYFIQEVDLKKKSFKNAIKFFYNYDAVKKLEQIIKEEKPDIAHLHNIAHHFSPAIINLLKRNNIKIIQTLHDYKLICPNYRLFSRGKICRRCQGGKYYNCLLSDCFGSGSESLAATFEAYLYRLLKVYDKVDLFIAPSEFMKKTCVDFGIAPERIEVIRNSIRVDKSPAEYEYGDYLLYFGRMANEKGLDVLLEAVKKTGNIKLKMVGEGPEFESIKENIKKENLENEIEVLGKKQGVELESLIENSKAIVISSVWPENAPYSLLESMAKGKPVVASRVGGLPELIEDHKNGFLYTAGNSDELASILKNLANFNLKLIGLEAYRSVCLLDSRKQKEKLLSLFRK